MLQIKKGNKQPRTAPAPESAASKSLGLFLIGFFKLGKGILFVVLGIGLLKLVDKDIDDIFREVISKFHIDEENHFVQHILEHLSLITNYRLREFSLASFIFSGLLLIEAFGLFWQKMWAEFMTIVETSLFIPFEIYGIIRHGTQLKVIILTINVLIVTYLLWVVIRKEHVSPASDSA
jgi:uncharacterized membrane protein (DUF2068 family)